MDLVDEIYTSKPFFGSRRVTTVLRRDHGYGVNRKYIQRLMRLLGIQGIAPGPNTSRCCKEHVVYPYLLNDIVVTHPNQVWASDITYVRLKKGFAYLVAILDWYSRFVISWRLSNSLDTAFCLEALEEALNYSVPEIFNSDQGSQFTSTDFTQALKSKGVQISMDGKGRAFDNIFVERLWRTVKYENIYLNAYETISETHAGLRRYFPFYNRERYHQSLHDMTPWEVYSQN
jgi:putative transposase